jgi:hypothetical protein
MLRPSCTTARFRMGIGPAPFCGSHASLEDNSIFNTTVTFLSPRSVFNPELVDSAPRMLSGQMN